MQAGLPVQALVHVRLTGHMEPAAFEAFLRSRPAVVDAWRMAADIDYELRIVCCDLAGLGKTLAELRHAGGVETAVTNLVTHRVDGVGTLRDAG